ncbi:LPS assembly lipoprotein LptE [Thermodesulfatator atlanticus]|uniref:LPS assembly lipoprotein LptE n=1 Tax=Thermodesulfatator atlanticus TaxID=501497 RepID=UPI0003B606C0|nr:LptE family protein [Thermodesulfatator atlanticus]
MKKCLLVFLFCLLCACGYQLEGRPSNFNPSWHTIYIPVWENPTAEIRLGEIIAQELRKRVELAGDLKIAPKDQADLILEGEIVSVSVGGLSYDVYTKTLERRVYLRAKAILKDREGRIIWQNSNISRYEDYPVESENVGEEVDPGREIALEKICRDLAEIIYHQIISSF